MTYEEAFEWCRIFENNEIKKCKNGKRFSFALQAMRECRKALSKQIPKKPREDRYPWAVYPKCSYAHISYEKNGHPWGSCAVKFSDINSTLYLTREEAEKVLAERK